MAPNILGELDAADLQDKGLLGAGRSTGTIRIHKRRLNRFSDSEYNHIPLNITPASLGADSAFVEIPIALISCETLIYVGLSEAKATELWNRWSNWPAGGPRRETDPDNGALVVSFKSFIIGTFENRTDASEEDDLQAWRKCLDDCGVSLELQNKILHNPFQNLFLSESCLFWVKDTVEMRYAGLEDIQRTSHERAMELSRIRSRPVGQKVGGTF